jgi:two-component system, NtrC family, response regulator AtoC
MAKVLVADDEIGIREFLADTLRLDDHDVVEAVDGKDALRRLDERAFDLLVTDLKMPNLDGLSLLKKARADQPELEVIVLTAHGSIESAVEAMKHGAYDYLTKPLGSPDELRLLVTRALERRRLVDVRDRAERAAGDPPPLTYGDPAMKPVVDAIEKVAKTTASVLLLGETGTGKEVAARTIHAHSGRRGGPFMALNCAAVADTLLESELFGHEKGAFTGASERRRGRVELASGGSFFLDEVGELKLELQAKMLRVLQERRFERVGGTRTLDTDVRWVAATNRDLGKEIAGGRFREDLYHRLAVFPIRLPPLRERKGDLVPIARALMADIAPRLGRSSIAITGEAEKRLVAWHWPGNVRELGNTLERAAILSEGAPIRSEHLMLDPVAASVASGGAPSAGPRNLADIERDAIAEALASVGGSRRRAAEILGIGERTLYDKLKRYSLE